MLSTKVPCCVNCGEAGGGRPDVCAAQVRDEYVGAKGRTERSEGLTRGSELSLAGEARVVVRAGEAECWVLVRLKTMDLSQSSEF